MWKIFWHNIGKSGSTVGYFYMLPGIGLLSILNFDKGRYYAVVEYLLFFVICLIVSVIIPQVPKAMFLTPYSKQQRIKYVESVFWMRVLISNLLNIITGVVSYHFGFTRASQLLVQYCVFFIITLYIAMLDYAMSYEDTTDVQKIGYTFLMIINLILMLITASIEEGDSIIWNYALIIVSLLIGLYLVHFYRKYYRRMLFAYSDYEKIENRLLAMKKKGK